MKYLLIIVKVISIQFLWGFILGTLILIAGWLRGYKNITQLTDILFIAAAVLLFFSPVLFRPKGLGFGPDPNWLTIVKVEPSDDETLLGLPAEEQKKHLSLEGIIILIKVYGIGIAMVFYSLIFYSIFGR